MPKRGADAAERGCCRAGLRATAARRALRATRHGPRPTATRYAPGDSTRVSTAAAFTAFAENAQSACSPIAQSSV